jgi:hypothetical protein
VKRRGKDIYRKTRHALRAGWPVGVARRVAPVSAMGSLRLVRVTEGLLEASRVDLREMFKRWIAA